MLRLSSLISQGIHVHTRVQKGIKMFTEIQVAFYVCKKRKTQYIILNHKVAQTFRNNSD